MLQFSSMSYTSVIVTALSVLTVISQALLLIFSAILIRESLSKHRSKMSGWLSSHALLLMLVVAFTATAGSLFFSDIAGWTPCRLCWYQRIFMYPQVLLLGFAVWKKDRNIAVYILLLSVIGAAFAIGHYGEQVYAALHPITFDPSKPCDTSGVSCAETPFFHFGYITIPLMAFTAFVLNALGSLYMLRSVSSRT